MKILGIETSTRAASVAVVSDDKVLAEVIQESNSPHSETLQVQIEEVLKNSGVGEKIDAVAISIGPGSFTGLRIGLAAAKIFRTVRHLRRVAFLNLAVRFLHLSANQL